MTSDQERHIDSIRLTVGAGTDRGLRRELNEDSFVAAAPLFAVADGMGGHEAGEVASRICVETLAEYARERPLGAAQMQQLLVDADRRIRIAAASRAGTTVTGAALVEERNMPYWLVFNVGDSRTYRLNQGKLEQVSIDHSEVQELLEAGRITAQEALVHPRRHVVTRALGTGDDAEPDFWMLPVEPGDRLLICSDGLTSEVSDAHIYSILTSTPRPQDAVQALIQAALRSGGRDNITVLVVDAADTAREAEQEATAPRPEAEESNTLPRPLPGGPGTAPTEGEL
ncbi:protein serine/threonine phosphatase [Arthrobacter crystallopoietes BAB-32]|uniref:Protein serine/threonine phosphatase n=1 Tax=Arthrobacter crystallopoietes BAB-32 TaxID=1246476 RepID=N1UZ65_9MICC|nr:PP2C family serine/threonine-protein phosphatase [Arthrobacter crystallopoietes]EMY34335.1 protein serine/threonine phosphatase [Arthrobacter crystallopoietes BAB-32]